jgi:uncharacterized protein
MRRLALTLLTALTLGLSSVLPAVASPQPEITPASEDAVIAWATTQIDSYYRTFFALQGQEYHAPEVIILEEGETAYTGCGAASGMMLAFYCPASEQIVIGRDVLDWVSETDDFVPAYVLSHEWAHHAQQLSGTGPTSSPKDGDWNQVYTIENELRADCMAGAWMGNVAHRGLLDATDMSGVLILASQIGGSLFGRENSHGDGIERLRAVFIGYEEGMVACMAITPLSRGNDPLIISAGGHY